MVKARSTNILMQSPAYPLILDEYNELFKATGGRVNSRKFFDEQVAPRIPKYKIATWYAFLARFKSDSRGIVAEMANIKTSLTGAPTAEVDLHETIMKNDMATQLGIQAALNIGARTLQKLMSDPEGLSKKELVDLLFKAMKAQDSRIHAVGKIREDNRDQARFDQTFQGSSMND